MIISVTGEFFIYETDTVPSREELYDFFKGLNENDILEVRIKAADSLENRQIYHVTKYFLENNLEFMDLTIPFSENTFQIAAQLCPYNAILPVKDDAGNCVSILKKIWTYYEHFYKYEGELDLSFLNQYQAVFLIGLNEYSIELYKKVLPFWSGGTKVYLVGPEWNDYLPILSEPGHLSVEVLERLPDFLEPENNVGKGNLYLVEGLPQNEDLKRYEMGCMYYDEIMQLTFMFSYVIHPGKRNPDKKFLLIDGFFRIEGIFGIWNKVFTAARYAIAKGYIPIFEIVSSDANMYSDHEGDDIWNKFFLQPTDCTLSEIHESSYLALSPNMNILNTVRYIMNKVSEGIELTWPKGIFNRQIQHYIRERQQRFLPCPEQTLGVLIRGTDYIKNPLPNHPKHATPDMIIEKIMEVEQEWGFTWIYLATEDKEICELMKKHFGERLTLTDQERYTVAPGQLLIEVHQEKKEGKGFRLGAEYLCSVHLLSQCQNLIASGSCGALSEALRENDGKYEHVYIFREP